MLKIVAVALLLCAALPAFAGVYELEMVKRLDKDVYQAKSGGKTVIIFTKYCYEYITFGDAILKYERYGDNKIIFDSGTSCEVEGIHVK
jgi:hypothetical protein